jgi:hypothetical protein
MPSHPSQGEKHPNYNAILTKAFQNTIDQIAFTS